ncbi:hypothetical protein CDAR_401221 [Caerostris darwini]|uniref:Reverse transcriptase domain-containing protein n=1 Tax=Caerostris darwini TaxID=1538125 RepID=A0AAV4V258_9ARAC|nr:hypothetical protein CDAR_401221 [Caerostris darwini]
MNEGIPQGSTLSLVLFTLYMTGIESSIPKRWEVAIFADDIDLWRSISGEDPIESNLNFTLTDAWKFATVADSQAKRSSSETEATDCPISFQELFSVTTNRDRHYWLTHLHFRSIIDPSCP